MTRDEKSDVVKQDVADLLQQMSAYDINKSVINAELKAANLETTNMGDFSRSMETPEELQGLIDQVSRVQDAVKGTKYAPLIEGVAGTLKDELPKMTYDVSAEGLDYREEVF